MLIMPGLVPGMTDYLFTISISHLASCGAALFWSLSK